MAEEPYVHQDYPKIMYHPSGEYAEVHSLEEMKALPGKGWVDTPAAYGVETHPMAPQIQQGGYAMQGYVAPEAVAVQEPEAPEEAKKMLEEAEKQAAPRGRR